jgi:hypothetical protein
MPGTTFSPTLTLATVAFGYFFFFESPQAPPLPGGGGPKGRRGCAPVIARSAATMQSHPSAYAPDPAPVIPSTARNLPRAPQTYAPSLRGAQRRSNLTPAPVCACHSQRLASEACTPASRNTCRPRKSGYTTAALSSAPSCSHVGHARIPTPPSQDGQCRLGHGAGSETRVSFANVKHTSWLKAARP